jgi:hypothetical protein
MMTKQRSRTPSVWTVQPLAVWEQLQRQGTLYVEERQLGDGNGYVPDAYRWLVKQLKRRVPGYRGHLPWWAHCAKPDLRCFRHSGLEGQEEVRLELDVLAHECLVFPCWAWNTVYGQNYLAATQSEHDAWMRAMREAVPDEDEWPLPAPWRGQLEASWERLFSPDLPALAWDAEGPWTEERSWEAVFEQLRPEQVRRVTCFRGTGALQRRVKRSAARLSQPPDPGAMTSVGPARHSRARRSEPSGRARRVSLRPRRIIGRYA